MSGFFERLLVRIAEAIALRLIQFVANRKRVLEDANTPRDIREKWNEWLREKLKNKK